MLSDSGHISRRNFLKAITVLGLSSCAPILISRN
ncbi:MAG: twin-arginine translocation signal domain-containing protein [Candidatus Marinimicrobia bacterium]|nr:twin-arginine translocation signal domain-containing protein [Candidatus Neomarinimicrobiota bacterium]MBT3847700.1 twin-arginine translocation signal domain-containing protein [Candidatus Neomarinimicrobiota bacterium]MBT4054941.1 twin-arginine translocation signal domain-containing protein [Candidatus Neomarinimicrobiota bacterium]MBT4369312.1 twin-arginine translocation signal domain-containing protein [Candidatus Neomarinimicrobiota bacterium]MBT4662990.1 twin-arginine translocation sign